MKFATILAGAMLVSTIATVPATAGTLTFSVGDGYGTMVSLDRDAVCKVRTQPKSHQTMIGRVVTRAFYESGRNGDVRVTYNGVHTYHPDVCGEAIVRYVGGGGGSNDGPANPGFKKDTSPTTDQPGKAH